MVTREAQIGEMLDNLGIDDEANRQRFFFPIRDLLLSRERAIAECVRGACDDIISSAATADEAGDLVSALDLTRLLDEPDSALGEERA